MPRCVLMSLCLLLVLPLGMFAADQLPSDAQRVMDDHESTVAEIELEMERQLQALRKKSIQALRELQDRYTRDGKLDEAVAIRDQIEALRGGEDTSHAVVLADPGRLYDYSEMLNQSFYFQVTGNLGGGSVWGSDIYTGDSHLATAAVHAGLVEPGQTAVVKVTILPGESSYAGTTRHGVTTSSYGPYSFSYKVAATRIRTRKLPTVVMPPQVRTYDLLQPLSISR